MSVDDIPVLEVIERISVEMGEDDRSQCLPHIRVLGEWDKSNAHGQFATVAVKIARRSFSRSL